MAGKKAQCACVSGARPAASQALPWSELSRQRNPASLPRGSPRRPLPSLPAAFSKVVLRWLRKSKNDRLMVGVKLHLGPSGAALG